MGGYGPISLRGKFFSDLKDAYLISPTSFPVSSSSSSSSSSSWSYSTSSGTTYSTSSTVVLRNCDGSTVPVAPLLDTNCLPPRYVATVLAIYMMGAYLALTAP